MDFKLVDRSWGAEIDRLVATRPAAVRIICPFIKRATVERLLCSRRWGRSFEVITRFDLNGFHQGVSDLGALAALLRAGGRVRGIRGLHSKLFLFDRRHAVAGSANLTEAAMRTNHEFGFVTGIPELVDRCHLYFEQLWGKTRHDLRPDQLEEWSQRLARARGQAAPRAPSLPDYGETVAIGEESPFLGTATPWPEHTQAFVKFFGSGGERAPLTDTIAEHVARGGCHWACTYGKRPRNVQDGATMFMARLTRQPNDIRIFGEAIGHAHRDGRDDASPAEIEARDWKASWPFYVRVHNARFINGRLADGISLRALTDRFGPDSYRSTQRNLARGRGNTNPRKSISQQPQIELTPPAAAWLSTQLDDAYRRLGTIDLSDGRFDPPPIWV